MTSMMLRGIDRLRHFARKRRWDPDLATGRLGEDLAHRFLRGQGYIVVARNYRTRTGAAEVDVIAWDGSTLVFVEVKSRADEQFGSPDKAVDREKEIRLTRAAGEYIRRAGVSWERVRFDIVSVVFGDAEPIRHRKDAFRPAANS